MIYSTPIDDIAVVAVCEALRSEKWRLPCERTSTGMLRRVADAWRMPMLCAGSVLTGRAGIE